MIGYLPPPSVTRAGAWCASGGCGGIRALSPAAGWADPISTTVYTQAADFFLRRIIVEPAYSAPPTRAPGTRTSYLVPVSSERGSPV